MNEVGYYEEFSLLFSKYLADYINSSCKIYFEKDNTLDVLVRKIETKSGIKILSDDFYVPKLKVDILFFVYLENEKRGRLILIEAKYLEQLSLINYSQLSGYLQVGKKIEIGLLLLIQKPTSKRGLSNEFNEILRLKKLPMNWTMKINPSNESYSLRTGIIIYDPNWGIDWVDSSELNGISSYEELISLL